MSFTIWQNINLNLDDWKSDLEEQYPDATEYELYNYMYETNENYLYDERMNCSFRIDGDIVVLADLGLWNGRVSGHRILNKPFLSDCLYDYSCEYKEWYCDSHDLRFKGHHHDGSNYYLYREIKPSLSDKQLDNFYEKLAGGLSANDIKRYTRSLRPYVAKVYGFK